MKKEVIITHLSIERIHMLFGENNLSLCFADIGAQSNTFTVTKQLFFHNNALNPQIYGYLRKSGEKTHIELTPRLSRRDKLGFGIISALYSTLLLVLIIFGLVLQNITPVLEVMGCVVLFAVLEFILGFVVFRINVNRIISQLRKTIKKAEDC